MRSTSEFAKHLTVPPERHPIAAVARCGGHFLAQHSPNYLTATTLGGTRYATMSAAGKKNTLKMKYPMKL